MKKLLSVSLAVVLALALCIPAMAAGWVAYVDIGSNGGLELVAENVITEAPSYNYLIAELSRVSSDGGIAPREYLRKLVQSNNADPFGPYLAPRVFYTSTPVTLQFSGIVDKIGWKGSEVIFSTNTPGPIVLATPGTYLLGFVSETAIQPIIVVFTSGIPYPLLTYFGLFVGNLNELLPTPNIWEPENDMPYPVKWTETFEGIAFNYYGTYAAAAKIRAANADYLRKTKGILEAGTIISLPLAGMIVPITPCNPINFGGLYLVKKGDTLSTIAKFYYGTTDAWTQIYGANRDRVPPSGAITPGQWLVIVK